MMTRCCCRIGCGAGGGGREPLAARLSGALWDGALRVSLPAGLRAGGGIDEGLLSVSGRARNYTRSSLFSLHDHPPSRTRRTRAGGYSCGGGNQGQCVVG